MATRYKYLDLTTDEERQPSDYNYPFENQHSAAIYISTLFKKHNVPFAFIGGFAMRLRGSSRSTQDIDVCVQTTMLRIWRMMEPEERLMIPDIRTIEGVFKMFVRTGPGWDDCKLYVEVEVDLILPGRRSSPNSLQESIEEVTFIHEQPDNTEFVSIFPVLKVRHMLKNKIRACVDRGVERDVTDIRFLVGKYSDEVRGIAGELDEGDVETLLERFEREEGIEMGKVLRGG